MAKGRDLAGVLAELASHHAAAAALAREAYDLMTAASRSSRRSPTAGNTSVTRHGDLVVSSSMCSVRWRGRCCVLGPSLLLRLMLRLSQHPERFFSYETLMEEVWERRCSDDALRALVCRLRHALKEADMPDLAAAIRTQGRCVGLCLNAEMP